MAEAAPAWMPSCEVHCWPGCKHWDAASTSCSPAHPSQEQGDARRDWPEFGLFSQEVLARKLGGSFVLITSKNTSASFLHHVSLGKCRRWRFASSCESELKWVQKMNSKGRGGAENLTAAIPHTRLETIMVIYD